MADIDPRADPSVPSLTDPAEMTRQAAVDDLGILDTPAEDRFDTIVRLARSLYGAQSAAFTVLDKNRVWHKSKLGTDVVEAERSSSFCSIAIKGQGAMIIGDARLDTRVADNPYVIADPGIRFYAGSPIASPNGQLLGTLCVWDADPRAEGSVDQTALNQLARVIELELRAHPFAREELDRHPSSS